MSDADDLTATADTIERMLEALPEDTATVADMLTRARLAGYVRGVREAVAALS